MTASVTNMQNNCAKALLEHGARSERRMMFTALMLAAKAVMMKPFERYAAAGGKTSAVG